MLGKRNYKKALSIYEKALACTRTGVIVDQKQKEGLSWFLRATVLAGLKRYDESIDSLIAAISLTDGTEMTRKFSVLDHFLGITEAKAIKKHPRWSHITSMLKVAKKRYSVK